MCLLHIRFEARRKLCSVGRGRRKEPRRKGWKIDRYLERERAVDCLLVYLRFGQDVRCKEGGKYAAQPKSFDAVRIDGSVHRLEALGKNRRKTI